MNKVSKQKVQQIINQLENIPEFRFKEQFFEISLEYEQFEGDNLLSFLNQLYFEAIQVMEDRQDQQDQKKYEKKKFNSDLYSLQFRADLIQQNDVLQRKSKIEGQKQIQIKKQQQEDQERIKQLVLQQKLEILSLDESIDKVQKQIKNQEQSIVDSKSQIQNYDNQIQNLDNKLNSHEAQLKKALDKERGLILIQKELQNHQQSQYKDLGEAQQKKQDIQNYIDNQQKSRKSIKQNISKSNNQIQIVNSKIKNQKFQLAKLESMKLELLKAIRSKDAEMGDIRDKNINLEKKIKNLKNTNIDIKESKLLNQQLILENQYIKNEIQSYYENQFLANQECENDAIKQKQDLIFSQNNQIEVYNNELKRLEQEIENQINNRIEIQDRHSLIKTEIDDIKQTTIKKQVVDVNKLIQLDIEEDGQLKLEHFKNLDDNTSLDEEVDQMQEILKQQPVKYEPMFLEDY